MLIGFVIGYVGLGFRDCCCVVVRWKGGGTVRVGILTVFILCVDWERTNDIQNRVEGPTRIRFDASPPVERHFLFSFLLLLRHRLKRLTARVIRVYI